MKLGLEKTYRISLLVPWHYSWVKKAFILGDEDGLSDLSGANIPILLFDKLGEGFLFPVYWGKEIPFVLVCRLL